MENEIKKKALENYLKKIRDEIRLRNIMSGPNLAETAHLQCKQKCDPSFGNPRIFPAAIGHMTRKEDKRFPAY